MLQASVDPKRVKTWGCVFSIVTSEPYVTLLWSRALGSGKQLIVRNNNNNNLVGGEGCTELSPLEHVVACRGEAGFRRPEGSPAYAVPGVCQAGEGGLPKIKKLSQQTCLYGGTARPKEAPTMLRRWQ